MTEFRAAYTQDGEWLQISTNPQRSGSLIAYQPEDRDVMSAVQPEVIDAPKSGVIDLDEGRGWTPLSSAGGTFSIYAPSRSSLEDWSLEIFGLPRIHDKLNEQGVTDLFGQDGLAILDEIHARTIPNRESVGDLRAKQQQRGPVTGEEMRAEMSTMGSIRIDAPYSLNEITQYNRFVLAMKAREDSGRLVVARNVLIQP